MIPRSVHQTWRSSELPKLFDKIYERNKVVNNNYDFKVWSHLPGNPDIDNFLKREYPDIYDIYEKTKFGVQKSDIARLILLYHYGGVYIDLDILCFKSFDNIIDTQSDNVYLCMEPNQQTKAIFNKENVLCNAFIATPARHEIFKQAIAEIKSIYNQHGDSIFKIFNCFGSDLLTKAIHVSDKNYDSCKFVKRELIFPICDPKLEQLDTHKKDIEMLKVGKYGNIAMIHYWVHSDFESKELLENFDYKENQTIEANIYVFFKELYKNSKCLHS